MSDLPLENFRENKPFLFSLTFTALYIFTSLLITPNITAQYGVKAILAIFTIILAGLYKKSGINLEGIERGLLLGSPFLINGVVAFIVSVFDTNFLGLHLVPLSDTVIFCVTMFLVGVSEELSFRSIILNSLLIKSGNTYKGMWKSLIISSVMFGFIHLVNMPHVNANTLVAQVICGISAGLCFGAIYIKTRNIWPSIFIHGIIAFLGLFVSFCFVTRDGQTIIVNILNMNLTSTTAFTLSFFSSIIPIILSIVLLSKKSFIPWKEEIYTQVEINLLAEETESIY